MDQEGNEGNEEPRNTLMAFKLEDKKAAPFLEKVSDYQLATRSDTLVVMQKKGDLYDLESYDVIGLGEAVRSAVPEAIRMIQTLIEKLLAETA